MRGQTGPSYHLLIRARCDHRRRTLGRITRWPSYECRETGKKSRSGKSHRIGTDAQHGSIHMPGKRARNSLGQLGCHRLHDRVRTWGWDHAGELPSAVRESSRKLIWGALASAGKHQHVDIEMVAEVLG